MEYSEATIQHLSLMKAVVEKMRDPLIITESDFEPPGPIIVYVNNAFYLETGYTAEEVIGKSPRILQGPGSSRASLNKIRQHLQRWEPVRVELLNYRKDQSEFWVELNIIPIVDPNDPRGWVTHWISVQKNVDERVRAVLDLKRPTTHYACSLTIFMM